MKEHATNAAKMNATVSESVAVCKSTTKKVDKIIFERTTFMENYRTTYNNNTASMNEALQNLGSMLKNEKINLEKIRSGLQQDHASFQTSLSSYITKLQDDLAMESKVMDALARKTEKVKLLDQKLQRSERQVKDLLSEKAVVRSCITDVTSLLSDIIETRESMISIMKQGEEGASKVEPPKVLAKPIIKKESKGKEKLIKDEPIIDDDEDEAPNGDEFKRRKARDAELNET
ncbi:unnamed protein product [Lactuca saligna]|uniref:Uncharacterized protein n=1 Tax=Lactuca saligna TaxID=75948 RepID=A0AA35V5M6_LACSI|nr:unnamed protein product [Lactuca saligna]